MKRLSKIFSVVFLTCLFQISNNCQAASLAPESFNDMYAAAAAGKISILKDAVHRGMNINIQNFEGDTGICLAIKRWDYRAYNSFRAAGANAHPYCLTELPKKQVEQFMSSSNIPDFFKQGYNAYYIEKTNSVWGWVVGGGILAIALIVIIA